MDAGTMIRYTGFPGDFSLCEYIHYIDNLKKKKNVPSQRRPKLSTSDLEDLTAMYLLLTIYNGKCSKMNFKLPLGVGGRGEFNTILAIGL